MKKPKFTKHNAYTSFIGENYASTKSFEAYDANEVDAYIDKLFKDAVRVSSHNQSLWFTDEASEPGLNTHQALLIGIEEIKKKCEHFPTLLGDGAILFECQKCGKQLKKIEKWELA